MKPRTTECFVCVLLFPALVIQAIFFTNSKDNDYPRIGKRPLPSYVYKTWYEQNRVIPRSFKSYEGQLRSRFERIIPEDYKTGYYNLKDSPKAEYTPEPESRRESNHELYNTIWSYIRPEEEFDY